MVAGHVSENALYQIFETTDLRLFQYRADTKFVKVNAMKGGRHGHRDYDTSTINIMGGIDYRHAQNEIKATHGLQLRELTTTRKRKTS